MNYFLEVLIKKLGDQMPNDNTVHMPCYITMEDLNDEFYMEMKDRYTFVSPQE